MSQIYNLQKIAEISAQYSKIYAVQLEFTQHFDKNDKNYAAIEDIFSRLNKFYLEALNEINPALALMQCNTFLLGLKLFEANGNSGRHERWFSELIKAFNYGDRLDGYIEYAKHLLSQIDNDWKRNENMRPMLEAWHLNKAIHQEGQSVSPLDTSKQSGLEAARPTHKV